MSKRTKHSGNRPSLDGKARRAFQHMQQRRLLLQQRRATGLPRPGEDLPPKQQQTQHNAVSGRLPPEAMTSDQ